MTPEQKVAAKQVLMWMVYNGEDITISDEEFLKDAEKLYLRRKEELEDIEKGLAVLRSKESR